jgi:hypothetical protein
LKKNIQVWGLILFAAVMAVLIAASVAPAAPATPAKGKKSLVPAPVAQTGQTECWNALGEQIVCTDTGQDGDEQAGVVSPVPRFTDNNNGTVTDNLTGLIWVKDPSCTDLGQAGYFSWAEALTAANNLSSGQCGLTDGSVAGDWRLPNVRELFSLIDFGESNSFPADAPFIGVLDVPWYWTSTTNMRNSTTAFYLTPNEFYYGLIGYAAKDTQQFGRMWPVRGGELH